MAKHIVTNVSDGPRIINASPAILLRPGESTPDAVEISPEEYEVAKGTNWFAFGAKAADPLDHDGDGRKGGHVANKKS